MKKIALLLSTTIFVSLFTGCSLTIPTISEASDIINAYVYYNKTGDLPPDIDKILDNFQNHSGQNDIDSIFSNDIEQTMGDILKSTSCLLYTSEAETVRR